MFRICTFCSRLRGVATLLFLVSASGAAATLCSCATYSRDMERVRTHYEQSEFPAALALLRVLADDQSQLTETERVQYAYLRGMTDFRLGAAVVKVDDRVALRQAARYWLEVATKKNSETKDALTDAERDRMTATLTVLEGKSDKDLAEADLE